MLKEYGEEEMKAESKRYCNNNVSSTEEYQSAAVIIQWIASELFSLLYSRINTLTSWMGRYYSGLQTSIGMVVLSVNISSH